MLIIVYFYNIVEINFVMKLLFSANKTQHVINPQKYPRPKSMIATEDLKMNMIDRLKNTKTCTSCGKNKVY
uniref:Uncharacterized protein n=1 Tax=viral metagenome TaxID=1070528 RepID=A0A6C0IN25_9ZZZZ